MIQYLETYLGQYGLGVSTEGNGAGVNVVKITSSVGLRVQVCAVISQYMRTWSSAEFVNSAVASFFSSACSARACSAAKFSRVILRKKSDFGSMSSITRRNWPYLILKKRRRAQKSACTCLWKIEIKSMNRKRESMIDPPEIRNDVSAGSKFSSAAAFGGLRDE